MYSLIGTGKRNGDPQVLLACVIARFPGMPVPRLPELLPLNWKRKAAEPQVKDA